MCHIIILYIIECADSYNLLVMAQPSGDGSSGSKPSTICIHVDFQHAKAPEWNCWIGGLYYRKGAVPKKTLCPTIPAPVIDRGIPHTLVCYWYNADTDIWEIAE